MGWQDDARRTVVSEKKALSTLEGYWVKVRLWTVGGKDEISTATRKVQKGLDKKALMSFAMKAKSKGADIANEQELMELLTPEEIGAFVDSESAEMADLIETKLRNGIAEHNFDGVAIPDLAKSLLEYPNIATEILGYIEEFNRPLARKTSKPSEMQPSGSTTEPPLNMGMSCQTEAIPQS